MPMLSFSNTVNQFTMHTTVQLMQCRKYYISPNMAPTANSQMEVTTMEYLCSYTVLYKYLQVSNML